MSKFKRLILRQPIRLMRSGEFLFAVWAGCQVAKGTSIVGIRTPVQMVIASDELRGQVDQRGDKGTPERACKIYKGPSPIYFAAAGVGFALNGRWISPEALLTPATFTGSNGQEQIRNAVNKMHSDLSQAWLELHKTRPQYFAEVIKDHATQLIFGWTDGVQVYAASFSAWPRADGSSTTPDIQFYPDTKNPSTQFKWMVGGSCTKLMSDKLNGNSPLPALPDLARELIQLEIDADASVHPNITQRSVGPPIDVLVINANEEHWYQREQNSRCFDLP